MDRKAFYYIAKFINLTLEFTRMQINMNVEIMLQWKILTFVALLMLKNYVLTSLNFERSLAEILDCGREKGGKTSAFK